MKKNEKNKFCRTFMLIATKKPIIFYLFVLLGIALFLFLTITTKVDSAQGEIPLLQMIFVKAGRS